MRDLQIFLILAGLAMAGTCAQALEQTNHAFGVFEFQPTTTAVLIAAPHGTFDSNTAPIALEAARLLGAGHVTTQRFVVDRVRLNVNRPTEGASLSCAQEARTDRARDVYENYAGLVSKASSGRPLLLYVEVHGNSRSQSSERIEVAARGISADQAKKIKDAYAAILAKVRKEDSGYPDLALAIEPRDQIFFTASCAKSLGILASDLAPRALHFELPRSARAQAELKATGLLISEIVRTILND